MSSLYLRGGKRALDVVVSSLGLIAGAPVLAAVGAAVRWRLGSPAIFSQRRPGLGGEVFTLHKFRTMSDARNPDGTLRPDAKRLTPFGRFLRATSLDELPELWNVLRGQMSLVGPRPLLVEYLPRYSQRQHRRHAVRPGITGLAQVQGRNALPWPERLELDVQYVERVSLALDLEILARTFLQVFRRDGITAPGQATVAKFMGEGAG